MFIVKCLEIFRAFLGGSAVKNSPAMQEMQFQSLGWEDPLEEEMATYSSILAWEIPWTEEPGRLQAMGLQRVGHDWVTSLHFTSTLKKTKINMYLKYLYIYWNQTDILSFHIEKLEVTCFYKAEHCSKNNCTISDYAYLIQYLIFCNLK